MNEQKTVSGLSGWLMLPINIALYILAVWVFISGAAQHQPGMLIGGGLIFGLSVLTSVGFFIVNPNEARVLQFFGRYVGTVQLTGFRWTNPLNKRTPISLRLHNFETGSDTIVDGSRQRRPSKVNDKDGNPIEIAAVVTWKVVDTYAAVFNIDDFRDYVHVQSEAAMRNLASQYPYDSEHDDVLSLRGDTQTMAEKLLDSLHDRLHKAGVEVTEARISHLAYAQEIASSMLQRQQAGAIIAARQKIVEGAVTMVENALDQLSERQIVELDDERRAMMVSNLLVVLCGQHNAQPVLNTGSIY